MWTIRPALCSSVLECDLKLCNSLDDYIKNTNDCRQLDEAVHKNDVTWWSYIPFTGIGNFNSYNKLYGGFELVEGLVFLYAIFGSCCYCCVDHLRNNPSSLLLGHLAFSSKILTAVTVVKVMAIICNGSFEWYEFAIMIISILISSISCNCNSRSNMRCWMISAFVNAFVAGVMEVVRDVYMVNYSENDGKGCPFI